MNKILNTDALSGLLELENGSVDCIVTSPPYWGLRDYGVDGQLGLEKTPEEFVNNLCDIFDKAKDVLKDDGTLWLNLGDSYFNTQNSNRNGKSGTIGGDIRGGGEYKTQKRYSDSLKQKDLVGIPWRVAFELQRRGWYLRQDIIWAKPNPMPESVKDRCTKSHEHIFLLTKSPKYYFDVEGIKEPAKTKGKALNAPVGGQKHLSLDDKFGHHTKREDGSPCNIADGMRRKRDVWFVPVNPFKEAHFATFPEALIVDCIIAGCPEGGTVLDPFMGAGTTAVVAKKNNRNSIGIELNSEYITIAENRINKLYRITNTNQNE